jgi:hypothetical protein
MQPELESAVGRGRLLWLAALVLAFVATLAAVVATGYRVARERLAARREPEPVSAPNETRPERARAPAEAASSFPPEASAPTRPRIIAEAPPPVPALEPPVFDAADARRTPEEALGDLLAALDRGDARTASKYLLDAKRRALQTSDEVLSELSAASARDAKIVEVTTAGDRAVLFATATSETFTDAQNRPLAMDAVFRLRRENGHWKLHTQRWLVNTPPGPEQKAALAWLEARPAAGGEDPARRLDALGLTADLDHFQSAVARNDLEQVRLFLEAGLDPNAQPEGLGQSLFGLALLGLGEGASDDVVLVMAGAGANLDARTPTGLTPLMQAALHCRPRVVEGLLGKGAPRSARDNDGRTAADWARMMCPAVLPLLGSR